MHMGPKGSRREGQRGEVKDNRLRFSGFLAFFVLGPGVYLESSIKKDSPRIGRFD